MPMRRPPRVMQLAATPAEPEAPSTEGHIPKTLEDAIVRLMQLTRMQTASETTPSAPRYANPTPTSRRTTTETVPQESTDVAMESSSRSKRDQDEDPDDLFDVDAGLTMQSPLLRLALVKDASEEKARAWFNRLKSASRRDGMTGDEVCALFGDLMAGPARQWYLQLKKSTRTSWTELTDQFRVQYCGKGVSRVSRYYHASKHVDETPLEYLYRLNVAGMRAKIHYSDGTPEEKREHVELFINTLGAQEQELASRLTLMEVPGTATLEKKLRARAVHAAQIATDDYDSGREGDSDDYQICDQDRDDEERDKMVVTGHALQPGNARRDFETAIRFTDEYARETPLSAIDLQPGERRGYWKQYAPDKWYKQAKIHGKLNNRKAVLLLDTGAEVSILDTTFAREVGCQIDTSVTQDCVGISETYFTVGKTCVKVTLAGNMIYYMALWVGDLVGQNVIFGMNFMVPAGVRIDTADGTACLLDEICIQMIGRRPLYGSKMRPVTVPSLIRVAAGQTFNVSLRPEKNAPRLWVTSVIRAPVGRHMCLRVTNITEKSVVLDAHTTVG
ncbi:Eukaryotic/viral aspartic protease [Phytophthora megakarya]|uniref:Eukaryotic/viral aspartic protease n=1 Tax=Phytophthora megakarya TaxID=4795 RepID=A0A225V1N5_9STRA|nr:Eukaryotic/viral aspartic protease [Phytophthora megakarya]